MRLIRGRESTTNFQTFPDSSQVSAPLRCQRQNRPILQLPPRQATEAKRLGSLFLRRKVARAAPHVPRLSRRQNRTRCLLRPTVSTYSRSIVHGSPWGSFLRLTSRAIMLPVLSSKHGTGTTGINGPLSTSAKLDELTHRHRVHGAIVSGTTFGILESLGEM